MTSFPTNKKYDIVRFGISLMSRIGNLVHIACASTSRRKVHLHWPEAKATSLLDGLLGKSM